MSRKKKYLIAFLVLVVVIGLLLYGKRVIDISREMKRVGTYPTRDLAKIKQVVIHHTATAKDSTPSQINQIHLDRFWPGIGYHYLIYENGTTYRVNPDNIVSNHVENNNTPSIGIAFVGDFSRNKPTASMYRAGKSLIRNIQKKYGNLPVYRHGFFKQTICPGNIQISKLT